MQKTKKKNWKIFKNAKTKDLPSHGYIVMSGESFDNFMINVTALVNKGWTIVGGVAVYGKVLVQAMYKKK